MDRPHRRFAVGGRLGCHLEPHNISLLLLNVSRNGFLVRSPMASRVDDVYRFRFVIEGPRDAIFVLSARVVHCAKTAVDGVTAYLTGLEFIDTSNPVCQRAIEHLVGVVTN